MAVKVTKFEKTQASRSKPTPASAASTALAKPASPSTAIAVSEGIAGTLTALADVVGSAVEMKDVFPAFVVVKDLEKVSKDLYDNLRKKIIAEAVNHGEAVPETKGTLRVYNGDQFISISPQRTGYDPKKVEAAIRAKGRDPAQLMDAVVTYKVNDAKLEASDLFTTDELDILKYDLDYRVTSPKKVNRE